MNSIPTPNRAADTAKRRNLIRCALMCSTLAGLAGLAAPVHAVDGCTVLLCFASSNWRSVPQCVPPIRQVLRDLARGKSFPTCAMAGAGNSADHSWASAPGNCPPQYTRIYDNETGPVYSCDYTGAVSVTVGGAPFARTWWSMTGDTVTEFSPAAKTQLGSWDTRYDADYAAWTGSPPAPALTPADSSQ